MWDDAGRLESPEWHSGGRRFDPVQLHHYFLGLRPESSPASQATSSKKSSKSSASGRNSAPLMTTWTHRPVAKEPPSQPTSAADRRGHSGQSQSRFAGPSEPSVILTEECPQRLRDSLVWHPPRREIRCKGVPEVAPDRPPQGIVKVFRVPCGHACLSGACFGCTDQAAGSSSLSASAAAAVACTLSGAWWAGA
jgi:hypothetical protein